MAVGRTDRERRDNVGQIEAHLPAFAQRLRRDREDHGQHVVPDGRHLYSNPWELTADLFGGVERPGGASYYVDGAIGEALQYFVDAYDAKDLLPKPKHENFPLQYLFPTQ